MPSPEALLGDFLKNIPILTDKDCLKQANFVNVSLLCEEMQFAGRTAGISL